MKNFKFASSTLATAILATTIAAPSVAQAEVSASVGISNFYLWRGVDLSNDGAANSSAPAISGDINVSSDWGGYAGVWASSGDENLGQEYDLYFGWGGEFGDFSVDVSYWTYVYPSASEVAFANVDGFSVPIGEIDSPIDPGDVADLVIGLGYAGVGFTVYENLEDDGAGARYVTLDYSFGDFNALVGSHDTGEETFEHLQFSYSYNDDLTFTVSKFLDDEVDSLGFPFNDDLLFNVYYGISF